MAAEDEYGRQLRAAEKKEEMLEDAKGRNNSNLRTLIELDLASKERLLQEEVHRKESKSLTFSCGWIVCDSLVQSVMGSSLIKLCSLPLLWDTLF